MTAVVEPRVALWDRPNLRAGARVGVPLFHVNRNALAARDLCHCNGALRPGYAAKPCAVRLRFLGQALRTQSKSDTAYIGDAMKTKRETVADSAD